MVFSRKKGAALLAGMAVPLIAVSAAYACAVLTTLALEPGKGRPGKTIAGSGGNYSADPTASEVEVRLDSRKGPLLWSGRPAADRKISFTFDVPRVSAGYHTVIATQYKADGAPVAGTPGRASLKVVRRSASGAVPAMWGKSDSTGSGAHPVPTSNSIPLFAGASAAVMAALAGAGLLLGAGVHRKTARASA